MRLRAAHHALAPPVLDNRLGGFHARSIEAIERARRDVAIELGAIGGELRLKTVENLLGKAARIGRRLHHQRRHSADNRSLRHAALSMPCQIVHYLAAAGRMADMYGVLQIESERPRNAPVGGGRFVMDSVYERRVWSGGWSSWPSGDRAAGRFVSDEWHGTK